MCGGITIIDQDAKNIYPADQKARDLIRRFNDPAQEHVLRGVFKDTDELDEVRAKQWDAETQISQVLSELVALRTVVDCLKAQGPS